MAILPPLPQKSEFRDMATFTYKLNVSPEALIVKFRGSTCVCGSQSGLGDQQGGVMLPEASQVVSNISTPPPVSRAL